jgi:hypothetical protein
MNVTKVSRLYMSAILKDVLKLYPGPEGIPASERYEVFADNQLLFLYSARVNFSRIPNCDTQFIETTPFAYFDFSGKVEITIKARESIRSVDIRPKNLKILPGIQGQEITFTLEHPCKITVELNGSLHNALHIFANPLEENTPDPGDPNVIYFGPGVHEAGVIELKDGNTLYVAGGAYVYGRVNSIGQKNINIRGRGILCGQKDEWPNCEIFICEGENVDIRDIVVLDSPCWTFHMEAVRNLSIENIKLICCGKNSDGFDLVSTQNATIHDCFIRNWDDGVAVKGLEKGFSRNITVTNCIIWSDAAQSLEVGYETRLDKLENVLFKNIDILHHLMPGYAVLTIHNGDKAVCSNIRFEDIRVEDSVSQLIDVWVCKTMWNTSDERGTIENVYFKNISMMGGSFTRDALRLMHRNDPSLSPLSKDVSSVEGYDSQHGIDGVTFENMQVLGRFVRDERLCNMKIGDFSRNIQFAGPKDGSPVASFAFQPDPGVIVNNVVKFDASDSFPQKGELVSLRWNFGDGATAEGMMTEHSYNDTGSYLVELTVLDSNGKEAISTAVVNVTYILMADTLAAPVQGLNYKFFTGEFDFHTDFYGMIPAKEGTCSGLNCMFNDNAEPCGGVFTGYIRIPTDGVYKFKTAVDFDTIFNQQGGTSWLIHGKPVSEFNNGWGCIGLAEGLHPFTVTVFTRSNEMWTEFLWSGPGVEEQEISEEVLYLES